MSIIDNALAANRTYARTHDRKLANRPAPKIAVVTCMDPRLSNLPEILGLPQADLDVIRTGGPAVTEDVLAALVVSTRVLGTTEIMLLNHTGCGFTTFADDELNAKLAASTGDASPAPMRFFSYKDPAQHTREQIERVRSHPWIAANVPVRGFVFDMEIGLLREVEGRRRELGASSAGTSDRTTGMVRASTAAHNEGASMSDDKTSPQYSVSAPAAGALGLALLAASGCAPAVSFPIASEAGTAPSQGDDAAIRPFQFHASEDALVDLRRRIAATKWPSPETVADGSQGVQLATMRALARYWQTEYDWRKVEARLNALPQFVTNIDGLDIHFIHVRSRNPHALPMIITHGWPGSIIEQLKVIEPLANPTAHGGSASDAFDVVIPSLPGHGFSGTPTAPGWDPPRIARAWIVLMKRLGYTRFVAQGGDWGNAVTEQMALLAPPELLAIHTNMPATVPDDIAQALLSSSGPPPGLSAEERHAYDQLDAFYRDGLAYAQEMSHRPQTLYGIDDSPIGLAAWMLDHDARSYELIARVFKGQQEGLTRDDVLDNVTLYWLTNTGVSAARLYWDTAHEVPLRKLSFFAPTGIKIPVAVTAFPDELYQAPRSWTARAYAKLLYYRKVDKGGHFAAWEQPELFSTEMRSAFRSLR